MATANTLHGARSSGFIKDAEANATRSRGFVGNVARVVKRAAQNLALLDESNRYVGRQLALAGF